MVRRSEIVHSPTISIVTPSYNQARYIGNTIESVLNQEGDFCVDYIIIDGNSTDNSIDIIEKYEGLLKKGKWPIQCKGIQYRWTSDNDRGQADAINKGFHIAKGGIVGWINSDDFYLPEAFKNIVRSLEENPEIDFIYGDGNVVNENGETQWEWLSRPFNLSLLKSYHFAINNSANYIMQQSVFWRSRVFEKIGFLDDSLHYGMDYEYWIRAGMAGLRFKHIPEKIGNFRMVSGTKSLSDPTVFWNERLEIFRRYNGAGKMKKFFIYYFY
ncbi:MAG: glycosyltransferase family 2 protein, partial [Nitrospirota bacterium]